MPIITISRGTFSGGRSLAECVAEKLGYRCISREALSEAANRYGAKEQKLYEALTKSPGILDRLSQERANYLAYIRAALLKEVKSEKIVYHGHAGHILLKGVPHLLRVRVIANTEYRIEAAMERKGLSREQSIGFIERVDDERVRWARYLYHVNLDDPSLYDLVVNLDRMSLTDACDIVCNISAMGRYERTLESQRTMDDLILAGHLKALVAADTSFTDGKVEVEADGGVVTLGGTVESILDADRVRMIVRGTSGVKDINSRMRVKSAVFTSE